MATRKNAAPVVEEPEEFPVVEPVEGHSRSRGNYKDSKPIELQVDSVDRPYSEAITDEHRALLEKYGQLRA